jgi:hypothetical protein
MTTETVSLHSFCKDNDLAKTTVRRWLNERGFSTSDGLNPEALEAAQAQFCPVPEPAVPAPTEPEPPTEPEAPEAPAAGGMTVFTGNHCTTLAAPGFDGLTVDLGQFRDSTALVIADPLAAAEQFLAAADLIQGALGADIAEREQRLARTKQAQAQVTARAQELALEQRLYRLQAAQIDSATTQETTVLADALAQLQSLGKPAAEAVPEA